MLSPLADKVRRGDPNRFYSVFFAPPHQREALFALYALNLELARIPYIAKDMLVAQIRLSWWRDSFAKMASTHQGAASQHEILQPLAPFITPTSLSLWEAMVQGRVRDIYPENFKDDDEAVDFINQTAGCLMRLAVQILVPNLDQNISKFVESVGFLYGFCLLVHAQPALQKMGRLRSFVDARGVAEGALQNFADLRHHAKHLPAQAYPALLPAQQAVRLVQNFITTGQMREPTLYRGKALWRQAWGQMPIL